MRAYDFKAGTVARHVTNGWAQSGAILFWGKLREIVNPQSLFQSRNLIDNFEKALVAEEFVFAGASDLADQLGIAGMKIVTDAVTAAENAGGSGLDKAAAAKDAILKDLAEAVATIPLHVINFAIESAVAQMNAAKAAARKAAAAETAAPRKAVTVAAAKPAAPPADSYVTATIGQLEPSGVYGEQEHFTPSSEQWGNAKTIVQVTKRRGMSPYAAVIAVSVAMQESSLRNLTAALIERGYSEGEIRKILGGNFERVFGQILDAS